MATTIGDKSHKTSNARIRWFGHVKRRNIGAPMQMCERIVLPEYTRCRKRRKKWKEAISQNIRYLRPTEDVKLLMLVLSRHQCGLSIAT